MGVRRWVGGFCIDSDKAVTTPAARHHSPGSRYSLLLAGGRSPDGAFPPLPGPHPVIG